MNLKDRLRSLYFDDTHSAKLVSLLFLVAGAVAVALSSTTDKHSPLYFMVHTAPMWFWVVVFIASVSLRAMDLLAVHDFRHIDLITSSIISWLWATLFVAGAFGGARSYLFLMFLVLMAIEFWFVHRALALDSETLMKGHHG